MEPAAGELLCLLYLQIMVMKCGYGVINESQVEEINEEKTNEKYLPEIKLEGHIKAFYNMEEAVSEIETIVVAVPTKAVREGCTKIKQICKSTSDNCPCL